MFSRGRPAQACTLASGRVTWEGVRCDAADGVGTGKTGSPAKRHEPSVVRGGLLTSSRSVVCRGSRSHLGCGAHASRTFLSAFFKPYLVHLDHRLGEQDRRFGGPGSLPFRSRVCSP